MYKLHLSVESTKRNIANCSYLNIAVNPNFLFNLYITTYKPTIMGATKKHFYTNNELTYSNLFKALGHPARFTIVQLLIERTEMHLQEIQTIVPLSNSTLTRHLEVLRNSGLLGYSVQGNICYNTVNEEALCYIEKCTKTMFNNCSTSNKSRSDVYFDNNFN